MHRWLPWIVALGAGVACGPRAQDSVHPAVCTRDPAALPSVDDAALGSALHEASHVVRGRIRFTGNAVNYDGDKELRYVYIIVDTLDFLKGDPWHVPERYRKSFPLLALELGQSESPQFRADSRADIAVTTLMCREDEALWFAIDLPSAERRPLHEVPDSVRRSFGPLEVRLHAVVPETERDRLVKAISR